MSRKASRIGAPRVPSIEAERAELSIPCATVWGVKRALPWVLGVVILTAVLVVGLSQAGSKTDDPAAEAPPFDLAQAQQRARGRARRRSPRCTRSPPQLLDGGVPAFEQRLAELKGTPVVINKWASWCNPCRAEFPAFQQLATERGKEIAFLGVNAGDSTIAGREVPHRVPGPVPVLRRPGREDRPRDRGARQLPDHGLRRPRRRDGVHPPGRLHVRAGPRRRRDALPRRMNQVRVDPLTGLKVIIAAARKDRPGGHFDLDAGAPIDTERDPFFPGHEDRTPPELHALRPGRRRARHAGLAGARRAEPLPGARARRRRAASPRRSPTCSPRSPRPARTR